MSTPAYPLDLEGKTEQAFIIRLRGEQVLRNLEFRRQADEQPKIDGCVIVSAKRGEEVLPVSGIFKIRVEVELSMRVRPRGESLAAFAGVVDAVESVFETHPAILAQQLTNAMAEWKCYIAEMADVDKKPKENVHHAVWSLQIEAMNVSSRVAQKLRPKFSILTN